MLIAGRLLVGICAGILTVLPLSNTVNIQVSVRKYTCNLVSENKILKYLQRSLQTCIDIHKNRDHIKKQFILILFLPWICMIAIKRKYTSFCA